jgi:hypothetical protein
MTEQTYALASDGVYGQTNGVYADSLSAIPDSGLLHRYDATELSLNDGDSVSTWTDQQADDDLTAGAAPTYKTGVINGNAVVRFDGVDDYLDVAFADESQPFHVFLALQWTFVDGGNRYVFDGETNRAYFSARDNNSADEWRISTASGATVAGGSLDTNFHIHGLLFNGGSSSVRNDGSEVATGDAGGNALDGITAGATRSQTSHAEADVGEILVYGEEKSGTGLDDVESYLADKWGVALS